MEYSDDEVKESIMATMLVFLALGGTLGAASVTIMAVISPFAAYVVGTGLTVISALFGLYGWHEYTDGDWFMMEEAA